MTSQVEAPERPVRVRLLRAGRALFAERGFEGASTREIAARAGVQQGLVRHYFGGKEGLWREVVAASLTELAAELTEAQGAPAAGASAHDPAARWASALIAQRDLVQLVAHALLEPGERRAWLCSTLARSAAVEAFAAELGAAAGAADEDARARVVARAVALCALAAFAPAWQALRGGALDAPSIARLVRDAWGRAPAVPSRGDGPWSLAAAARRRARDS
jgi:AcrR family transcriptional regulator